MHRRRADLPLSVYQALGIVQSSLTFAEGQAWTKKDSMNHRALQPCHGQEPLLATAVPGQGLNFLSAEKLRNILSHFTTLKGTPTAKLAGQCRMSAQGASVFSHFQVAQLPWAAILTKFTFSCPVLLFLFTTHNISFHDSRETFLISSYLPFLQI